MIDSYVYAIVALLPLSALMLMIQTNPYQALVIRGILGAVAALVYAVLGGADVALTEALVGTMLAVTLFAVAVRSSLVMRLGVLEADMAEAKVPLHGSVPALRTVLKQHYLRLEMVPYAHADSLSQALTSKDVHGIYQAPSGPRATAAESSQTADGLTLRVPRLYEILSAELPSGSVPVHLLSPGELPPATAPSVPPTLTETPYP
ncbi:MAG: DUF4040 domain-containing protein [Spirulina sp.]